MPDIQFNRNKARTRWKLAVSSLKSVEDGFDARKHAAIFTTREPEHAAIDEYLDSVRLDLRNPRILPQSVDGLLKECRGVFDTHPIKKTPKDRRKQAESGFNLRMMLASLDFVREFHGKSLREAWAKHDEINKKKAELDEKEEGHDYLTAYKQLLATAFNNTLANHWEEANGRELDRRILGYKGDSKDEMKTHAERTAKFLQHLHDEAEKREEEAALAEKEGAERRKFVLEEASKVLGCYRLTEKERTKLGEMTENLIADNNPRALDLLDQEALSLHNKKLESLAGKEPYSRLQLLKRLRLLTTKSQRQAIAFAAVHHMHEGVDPQHVGALFPSLPVKPSAKIEGAQTGIQQPKPKMRFPLVEKLPVSDDEKNVANRLLRAQRGQLTPDKFDEFLRTLEEHLNRGEGVLDAIRKMHAAFHPKEEKKATQVTEPTTPKPKPAEYNPDALSVGELLEIIDKSKKAVPDVIYALKKKFSEADEEQRTRITEHVIMDFLAGRGTVKNLHWDRIDLHVPKLLRTYANEARNQLRDRNDIEEDEGGGNKWKITNRLRAKYSRKH